MQSMTSSLSAIVNCYRTNIVLLIQESIYAGGNSGVYYHEEDVMNLERSSGDEESRLYIVGSIFYGNSDDVRGEK